MQTSKPDTTLRTIIERFTDIMLSIIVSPNIRKEYMLCDLLLCELKRKPQAFESLMRNTDWSKLVVLNVKDLHMTLSRCVEVEILVECDEELTGTLVFHIEQNETD